MHQRRLSYRLVLIYFFIMRKTSRVKLIPRKNKTRGVMTEDIMKHIDALSSGACRPCAAQTHAYRLQVTETAARAPTRHRACRLAQKTATTKHEGACAAESSPPRLPINLRHIHQAAIETARQNAQTLKPACQAHASRKDVNLAALPRAVARRTPTTFSKGIVTASANALCKYASRASRF